MDNYSLKARVFAVAILLLPTIIIGIAFSINFKSYNEALTSLGVTAALLYLLSNLGRDKGKQRESLLWEAWGGSPTNKILCFDNGIISLNTKLRYHEKLQQLCPMPYSTSPDFEKTNPNESKDIYRSWTEYLLSKTRDDNKFPLLAKENISYGFRRNLLGLKPYGITLIIIVFISYFVWQVLKSGFHNMSEYPVEFYISEAILVILLFFWLFVVNKSWVRIPAFAYAKRLFETLDTVT
jgi:hypothetical protein